MRSHKCWSRQERDPKFLGEGSEDVNESDIAYSPTAVADLAMPVGQIRPLGIGP
jgi:hypothetical protein